MTSSTAAPPSDTVAAVTYSSIREFHSAIDRGETTVQATVEGYLAEIKRRDEDLNAFVTVDWDGAVKEAERLDALPKSQRGPLHGLPLAIKDQIETSHLPTTYGSIACKDHRPSSDATVIIKLRSAGALILGKTTLPDFAAGWFSTSSLSGTTRHPSDLTRDPGGSSSGSATAVAAGMAMAGIGGDTGGSIRLPASFCGLVGVRCTPGRISRKGMSSLVKTQDTAGPMTRKVEDAARLLDVLVGWDEGDEFTGVNVLDSRRNVEGRFSEAVKSPKMKGRRVGVLRQVFGKEEGVRDCVDGMLGRMKDAGMELVDVEIPDLKKHLRQTSVYVLRSKADINAFCAEREGLKDIKVEDLHKEGRYHEALDLFSAIAKGWSKHYTMNPHFGVAMEAIGEFQRAVGALFARHDLEALVYPTCQVLAPKTQDILDGRWLSLDFPTNTVIGSQLLWTALSVPIGKAKDDNHPDDPELPVGLEILGLPMGEETILSIAAGVEALQQK